MKKILIQTALILTVSAVSCLGDAMHGYCAGAGQCIDNFGFTISPGPASGDLRIDILTPNNEAHAASYGLTGSLVGTATLLSGTPWTSGKLDAFLGISASPANPIGAFLSDPSDGAATGFFAFQVDFGIQTLQGASNPNVFPLENFTSQVPVGSYIVAFLNEGTAASPDWAATASGDAILETADPPAGDPPAGDPPTGVPEPSSIILLGSVALGIATVLKTKSQSRA